MIASRGVVGFGALLLLVACGEPGEIVMGEEPPTFEEFLAQVYVEPETGIYIVNGDTPVVGLKRLHDFYELLLTDYYQVTGGALIVNRSGGSDNKWNDADKLNITYCVSTGFGNRYASVVQAMADAAGAWEAVANVNYVYVSSQDASCTSSNNAVVFNVAPVNAGGQYLARAFFPYDPRSARSVLIDNSAFTTSPPPTVTGVLRHELGHTLGFRHEHTRPEAGTCYEDSSWRALTPYDSASVMHYPQCNGTGDWTLVLTARDVEGAGALYGAVGVPPPPAPGSDYSGSLAQGQTANFGPFTVAAGGRFDVVMTGSGDPDLYVRWGAPPTTSTYNCRPYLSGASETCSLTVPSGTTSAYVMVRGYTASSYALDVTYTPPSAPPPSGTPVTQTASGSLALNQTQTYGPLSVLAGTTFTAVMTGTGDPDLYVRWGSPPTTSSYNCRPYLDGASETCSLTVPSGTTSAYVMVRGYTASTYNLTVSYTQP